MEDEVILVDEADRATGTMEKLAAHRAGRLHRAFSVFLFAEDGRWLLQRRAAGKYHSGGLWSNACCSHPRPGEEVAEAAARRLGEELGVACPIAEAFALRYDLDVGGGLREAEYNHVFLGRLAPDAPLDPDPAEASACAWRDPAEIEAGLAADPGVYSPWFAFLFPKVLAHIRGGGALNIP